MTTYNTVPLSDDEYNERVRETEASIVFCLAAMDGALVRLGRECERAALAWECLGAEIEAYVENAKQRLTPDERDRYNDLIIDGVLPCDALAEIETAGEA